MYFARARALLHDVGQFMGEEAAAFRCVRRKAAGAENDVVAYGVGAGVERFCGGGGAGVGVDANFAEVEADARLHVAACLAIEEAA